MAFDEEYPSFPEDRQVTLVSWWLAIYVSLILYKAKAIGHVTHWTPKES